jgi:hypothetical protein
MARACQRRVRKCREVTEETGPRTITTRFVAARHGVRAGTPTRFRAFRRTSTGGFTASLRPDQVHRR